MSPPLPSPCDGYAQAIVLRVDRELGRAESAALDAHLEGCAACRLRVRKVEGLASVLKHWDAVTNQPVAPPDRLAGAILSQVAETARHRSAEERRYRGLRFAQAAAVVAGLAASVVAGLGAAPAADPPPAAQAVARSISEARLLPPDAGPGEPFPAGREPVAWGRSAPLSGLEAGVRITAEAVVLPLLVREARERHFEVSYGERGQWVRMPDGEERLLTVRAARYLADRDYFGTLRRKATQRVYARGRPPEETGRRVADFLPMPKTEDALAAWLPNVVWTPLPLSGVRVAEIPPALEGGVAREPVALEVLSAEEAVVAASLKIVEGESPTELIAIARGNRLPIHFPAGEIFAGGERDRVVARSTWIPAGEDRRHYLIPCAVVSTGRSRFSDRPVSVGTVAGPGLRSLLARGATGEAVLDVVRRQVGAMGFRGHEVSLVDVFGQPSVRAAARERARSFPRAMAGFAAIDRDGRLAGVESIALGDRATASLAARLLTGYDVEAMLRLKVQANGGLESMPPGTSDVFPVLTRLLAEGASLRWAFEEEGVRVARLAPAHDEVVVESVEVGGRPALFSALRPW